MGRKTHETDKKGSMTPSIPTQCWFGPLCRHYSCLLRSTHISQSTAVARIPIPSASLPTFSHGLRKLMKQCPLVCGLVYFQFHSFSGPTANWASTYCGTTWIFHLSGLQGRMCWRLAGLPHSMQQGFSISLHLCRFVGSSIFHISCQTSCPAVSWLQPWHAWPIPLPAKSLFDPSRNGPVSLHPSTSLWWCNLRPSHSWFTVPMPQTSSHCWPPTVALSWCWGPPGGPLIKAVPQHHGMLTIVLHDWCYWQLQLIPWTVQVDGAETLRDWQPPPQETVDFPLQGFHCRQ